MTEWTWWSEEQPAPTTMFSDRIVGPEYLVVLCPVCGFNYTHLGEAFTRFGTDEHEGGHTYKGTVAKGVSRDWRRDGLVLVFTCESGHMWQLIFQQHKGQTFVLYRYAEKRIAGQGTYTAEPAFFGDEET